MTRTRSKRFLGIPDEYWIAFVIMTGFFLKFVYDTKIGWTRGTVSLGTWAGSGNGSGKGGHLSVIQYYYTNHVLPNVSPRNLTYIANPPFYYMISALILGLLMKLLRWSTGFSLNCLQCVNVFYVMIGSFAGIGMLRKFGIGKRKMLVGIIYLMFFPVFYNMGAAMDGSAMTFMFAMLALNSSLRWYQSRRAAEMLLMAVYAGLGMMTSYRTVFVLPPLIYLITQAFADGRRNQVPIRRQILIFAGVFLLLGLWWPLYLKIALGLPFFYVQPSFGMTITTSVAGRLMLPGPDILTHLHTAGNSVLETNLWGQLIKTAVVDFSALQVGRPGIQACAVLLLSLVTLIGVVQQLMLIFILLTGRVSRARGTFLLIGEASYVIGYVISSFRFSYVGMMDFKAIAPVMIFPLIASCLCGSTDFGSGKARLLSKAMDVLILIVSILTAFLYGFYY